MHRHYKIIDSTNDEVKRLLGGGEFFGQNFYITADEQKNGRGTGGRQWDFFSGNIFMSACIKKEIVKIKCLSFASAIAVKNAIGSDLIYFKWINDILIENRKFGGILIEECGDYWIIGIGLNVTSSPEYGTFLQKYNLGVDHANIYNQLFKVIKLNDDEIIDLWKKNCIHKKNDDIYIRTLNLHGKFIDIDDAGGIKLEVVLSLS